MNLLLKIILIAILIIGGLTISLFDLVDQKPYKEKGFYKETIKLIESLTEKPTDGDTIQAGWSKESIVPFQGLESSLTNYGKRRPAPYSGIKDSIWVRTVYFNNGINQTAIISADLLIISNELTNAVSEILSKEGIECNLYWAATHTHSSIGGWAKGTLGRVLVGKYSSEMVSYLAKQIFRSIVKASSNAQQATIGFSQVQVPGLVINKLVGAKGSIDPWFRMLRIQKNNGESAIISSYSAHATCLSHHYDSLSGDFPGLLNKRLEALDSIDFALFMAGGVGGHAPIVRGHGYTRVSSFVDNIMKRIRVPPAPRKYYINLSFDNIDLKLRKPHIRISDKIRLRPWVFKVFSIEQNPQITVAKIGDFNLLGMPADFSGELIHRIESSSPLMVTSFNGTYIGYVIKDDWHSLNKPESREMNWYGHDTGSYLVEVSNRLLNKLNY